MTDTIRSRSELLTLYADNVDGNITAQHGRDHIKSGIPLVLASDLALHGDGWQATDLTFEAAADSTYTLRLTLLFVAPGTEGSSLEVRLDTPTGAALKWAPVQGFGDGPAISTTTVGGVSWDSSVAGGSGALQIVTGALVTDASGTVTVEATSSGSDPSTLYAGSMLEVFKAG